MANYLWHQRALSLRLSFLRTLPHSAHFTPSTCILPLQWKLNKSHLEKSEQNIAKIDGANKLLV